ncbi:Sec-independent protein translocase subunit TatA/TatB [Stetteria hydrogenophila]
MPIGPFQTSELLIIFLIIVILLGPRKLPELARALGEAVSEFKKAAQGANKPVSEAKQTVEEVKKSVESPVVEVIEETKKK